MGLFCFFTIFLVQKYFVVVVVVVLTDMVWYVYDYQLLYDITSKDNSTFVSTSDKNVIINHKYRYHHCPSLDEPMNFTGVTYKNLGKGLFTEVKNFVQRAHLSLGDNAQYLCIWNILYSLPPSQ